MSDARKHTNKLLEMVDDGRIDKDMLIMAFAKYLSEADVEDLMHINEIMPIEWDDEA